MEFLLQKGKSNVTTEVETGITRSQVKECQWKPEKVRNGFSPGAGSHKSYMSHHTLTLVP